VPRTVIITGEVGRPLVIPPAYQEKAPYGANFGGTNPIYYQLKPTTIYDSWLTIGILGGDSHSMLNSIGIPWETWTDTKGLFVTNGGGALNEQSLRSANTQMLHHNAARSNAVPCLRSHRFSRSSQGPDRACRRIQIDEGRDRRPAHGQGGGADGGNHELWRTFEVSRL
jgi:hypothetical protein